MHGRKNKLQKAQPGEYLAQTENVNLYAGALHQLGLLVEGNAFISRRSTQLTRHTSFEYSLYIIVN